MIRLEVEEYCQNCGDFDPGVITTQRFADNTTLIDTTVVCRNRYKCADIYKYLKETISHGKTDN